MSKIYRSDIYVRDESGPEWFNEFLQKMSGAPEITSVQDILSAINNKRTESVESVVKSYREQVGLDALSSQDDEPETIKTASANRPLSIRHAEDKSVVQMIEDDGSLKSKIDSHCEHTGGTKNIESLILFLRSILGDKVSFSDQELRDYLEGRKSRFKNESSDDANDDVGRVGIDSHDSHDDDIADYIKYDGAK